MNRMQKKCVIATAGFHLLLLVILLVGPAFFAPKPKVDDSQVLDVIPHNILDDALNSGVRGAQPPPPAPAPMVTPPPQPQPVPPAPKIVPPAPAPEPTLVQKVEKILTPEPPKPAPVPEETKPHTPKIDLSHPVTRDIPKYSATSKSKDNSQQKLHDEVLRAARDLQNKLSSPVAVGVSGDSSAEVANYASVVKSIYEQAWTPPDDAANDDANTKVSVTISSDGTVITAHIITPSGDAGVDATVQRTLERVKFIRPFPDGSADKERTYIINFNLKAKRMLG
jgi:TonB family protein